MNTCVMFQSSKQFAVGQVLECVEDITAVLENKPRKSAGGDEEGEEQEQPGHFVSTIDKVQPYITCCNMHCHNPDKIVHKNS